MKQKFCIFCGQSGMSKEHFWPSWIREHIKKDNRKRYIHGSVQGAPKGNESENNEYYRSGDVTTITFRTVCKSCNNGWMSNLEENLKPIILNSMGNCDQHLSESETLWLAKWITMKTMVSEHTKLDRHSTPESDLLSFGANRIIPKHFQIYVAKHNSPKIADYSRTTTRLGTAATIHLHLNKTSPNTQAVSFYLGKLFIFIFSCTDPTVNVLSEFKLNQMTHLKDNKVGQLNFKTLNILSEREQKNITHGLEKFINREETRAIT
ncbi:hypothetical protein ACJJIX_12790 [Microbulbifer sp. VAAC004]|uniref:hypothetical protein n=1 Tax=unclassified Microbulbifer TaxID=2619833 RepID=UPI00403944CB